MRHHLQKSDPNSTLGIRHESPPDERRLIMLALGCALENLVQAAPAHGQIAKLMDNAETKKAMYDAGVEISPSTPEALGTYMVQEMDRWGKVVKDTGVKME